MQPPETRPSLLARIRNPADREAWHEFSEVYRPVIIRLAIAKGLQVSDADDLAQQVLLAVSTAINGWKPEGSAKFRTWLKRVTDNAVLNALTRAKPDRGSGNDDVKQLLEHVPDRNGPDSNLLRIEFQREVFAWAVKQIRDEFSETTWNAFWMTAVESMSADVVGMKLGRSRGGIYAARSRVMQRLIEKVEEFDV